MGRVFFSCAIGDCAQPDYGDVTTSTTKYTAVQKVEPSNPFDVL